MHAPAKPPRTVSVSVRLSPAEKRAIAEKAERLGLKAATWMRMLALTGSGTGDSR